jgi:hypothetical protein
MHRFIARLTLVWMLVAVLAPAALAVAAPSPHACCKRKPMAMRDLAHGAARFSERQCANHDCCRSLAVPQRSEPAPRNTNSVELQPTNLLANLGCLYRATELISSTFVRGPPVVA